MMEPTPYDRITGRRIALGISERELCRRAALNETTLANAKRNGGALELATIKAFAAALGCPLADLLGEDAAAPARAVDPGVALVGLLRIQASPLNPRKTFDEVALAELADSIAAQGLLQNLVVREKEPGSDMYWIVAGERRFRALEILHREDRYPPSLAGGIPCRIIQATDDEHLALSLLENLQRQDVNPMEEANAFSRLIGMGWTTGAIAEKIGTTQRHVQQRVALTQRLAPEAQAALIEGKINFTQARALILAKAKEQADLVKNIANYPTADLIRNRATAGMILADRAAFKHAEYLGEILEADDGKKYFPDREAFFAAQRQAVQRRADELRAEPGIAFVEIKECTWPELWEFPEATEGAERGVVIHVHSSYGIVTEYPNRMLRPEEDQQAVARREAERAAFDAQQKAERAEVTRFRNALAAELKINGGCLALAILLSTFGRSGWPEQFSLEFATPVISPVGEDWEGLLRQTSALRYDAIVDMIQDAVARHLPVKTYRCHPAILAAADILGIDVPAVLRPKPEPEANAVRDDDSTEAPEDDAGEEFEPDDEDDEAADPIDSPEPWTPITTRTACPDDIA